MSVLQIKHSTLQILLTDSHGTQQNMPIMQTKRHLSMPTVEARRLPPHMQLDKEGQDPVMISCSCNWHSNTSAGIQEHQVSITHFHGR